MSAVLSPQAALVYVMVIAALADGKLQDTETNTICEYIKILPIFNGYEHQKLTIAMGDCASLLDQEDGIDTVIGLVKEALPVELRETAYALACDIVAADGKAEQAELQWLNLLRDQLTLNPLHTAAIERGSKAHFARAEDVELTHVE